MRLPLLARISGRHELMSRQQKSIGRSDLVQEFSRADTRQLERIAIFLTPDLNHVL